MRDRRNDTKVHYEVGLLEDFLKKKTIKKNIMKK